MMFLALFLNFCCLTFIPLPVDLLTWFSPQSVGFPNPAFAFICPQIMHQDDDMGTLFQGLAQQMCLYAPSLDWPLYPDPGPSLIPSMGPSFSNSTLHQKHLEILLEKSPGPQTHKMQSLQGCEVGPKNLHSSKLPGAADAVLKPCYFSQSRLLT